jgi:hypothetical protein
MRLDRKTFEQHVFKRDGNKCVFCDKPAIDAHHILERKLFHDGSGGYYLDNGASVCAEHHLLCETTDISVEDVRRACGITNVVLPAQLSPNERYDKWGNIILEDGSLVKGELFYDTGVQKILRREAMNAVTNLVKYPRTYHLSFSEGATDDDKMLKDTSCFDGEQVIITEKMDGENTSLYPDYFHARSLDGNHHWTRDWVKQYWSSFAHDIPAEHRICGENLFARHSIAYDNLKSYFMGFSMWHNDRCLSWDETITYFELLGIEPVPVLYRGIWDEKIARSLYNPSDDSLIEGIVVRKAGSFMLADFKTSVAKAVRKNHVQTEDHWMYGEIQKNGLIS